MSYGMAMQEEFDLGEESGCEDEEEDEVKAESDNDIDDSKEVEIRPSSDAKELDF